MLNKSDVKNLKAMYATRRELEKNLYDLRNALVEEVIKFVQQADRPILYSEITERFGVPYQLLAHRPWDSDDGLQMTCVGSETHYIKIDPVTGEIDPTKVIKFKRYHSALQYEKK